MPFVVEIVAIGPLAEWLKMSESEAASPRDTVTRPAFWGRDYARFHRVHSTLVVSPIGPVNSGVATVR